MNHHDVSCLETWSAILENDRCKPTLWSFKRLHHSASYKNTLSEYFVHASSGMSTGRSGHNIFSYFLAVGTPAIHMNIVFQSFHYPVLSWCKKSLDGFWAKNITYTRACSGRPHRPRPSSRTRCICHFVWTCDLFIGSKTAHSHLGQLGDWEYVGAQGYHMCGGPDSRDLHRWSFIQAGQQLLVALQAFQPQWRVQTKVAPLQRGWWRRPTWRQDKLSYQAHDLVLLWISWVN